MGQRQSILNRHHQDFLKHLSAWLRDSNHRDPELARRARERITEAGLSAMLRLSPQDQSSGDVSNSVLWLREKNLKLPRLCKSVVQNPDQLETPPTKIYKNLGWHHGAPNSVTYWRCPDIECQSQGLEYGRFSGASMLNHRGFCICGRKPEVTVYERQKG